MSSSWTVVSVPNQTLTLQLTAGVVGPQGPQGPSGSGSSSPSCIVATVFTNLAIFRFTNNGGVGDTLTSLSGGPIVINGHTLAVGDTLLLSRNTVVANGLYVVTVDGATGGSAVLVRDTRLQTGTQLQNTVIYISPADSSYRYSSWLCSNTGTVTVGTTSIGFKKLNNDFELTVNIPTPAVGTYTLRGYAARPGALTSVQIAQTAAGSVTASLVTGGTLSGGTVTGGTTVTGFPSTINTTPQSANLTTTFNTGDPINFVVSAVSGASGLVITIIGTNT